ncbi:hypothetical protein MES4922_190037 [Mesorhizobium ventifaucium]|uniref:Uncharacterized protein n=1 Tax=Mesorhizobium ventifaucium TaxID=666020 RepID=A0ABN8JHR2_9HYPH|nr:hypothetical protein MES4922_190037 [Mesorhizobium ventifaucium]
MHAPHAQPLLVSSPRLGFELRYLAKNGGSHAYEVPAGDISDDDGDSRCPRGQSVLEHKLE